MAKKLPVLHETREQADWLLEVQREKSKRGEAPTDLEIAEEMEERRRPAKGKTNAPEE